MTDAPANTQPSADDDERYERAQRRLWLLLVFDALEHAGLAPVTARQIHAFVYFADALSPIYELRQLEGEILKRTGGPFYPDVQWDIDRLAIQQLLSITDIDWSAANGETIFNAEYGLADAGAEAVALLLKRPEQREKRDFLCDLAVAFGRAYDSDVAEVVQYDANYGRDSNLPGELIRFRILRGELESPQRNFSHEMAESFDKHLRLASPLTDPEKLHLYVNTLRRASHGG